MEQDVKKIAQALRQVFGENVESGRFFDTTRIPFICKDIEGIHETLRDIKELMEQKEKDDAQTFVNQDQFWPVKTITYGLVALMLTGIIGAILAIVTK